MNYVKISGTTLIILSIVILYFKLDIFEEIFDGRKLSQINLSELTLPIITICIGIFLIMNKNKPKNEKNSM